MDAAKRRVVIKQQTTKKKEVKGQQPKETGSSNPSTKRKLPEKQGRLRKKPKTILEPVVGLEAEGRKMVTPAKHGAGKGLMKGLSTTQDKPPVLLREDSKYALEKLSSILTSENYEDLGNHAMEAIGEMGLFCIAQVSYVRPIHYPPHPLISVINKFCFQAMVMMKGLMGWCLNHETVLDHVRSRANETQEELNGLKAWRVGMEKKLSLSEKVRKELNQ